MTIILVIAAIINGTPHQTKLPMETIEQCTVEAAKFLNYAITDKDAEHAAAMCEVAAAKKEKS